MARRWGGLIVAVALATCVLAWDAQPAATASTHDGGPRRDMLFPVAGSVTFTDTHGASRDGGRRRHEGQDLMGAKMTPLVAAVDGQVTKVEYQTRYGNAVVIKGADGWTYRYLHVNNDTPGTDNDRAAVEHAFGPGIKVGVQVKTGQLLGFLGDSGNAESTAPHLHFELRTPDGKAVNAHNALLRAYRIGRPLGLPAGYELPPLGTTKATPRQQVRSTSTTRPKSTTTTTRRKSTTTTAKPSPRRTTTTTKPKTTSTTRRSTTTTTRPKSTTTTVRRTTTTTRRTTTTTR